MYRINAFISQPFYMIEEVSFIPTHGTKRDENLQKICTQAVHVVSALSGLNPGLRVDDLLAVLDHGVQGGGGLVLRVVIAGHPRQRHDVGRRYLDHRQLGQLAVLVLTGNGSLQGVKSSCDGVHSLALTCICLHPPLPRQVLVVALVLLTVSIVVRAARAVLALMLLLVALKLLLTAFLLLLTAFKLLLTALMLLLMAVTFFTCISRQGRL